MTLLIAAILVAPTEGAISVLNIFFLTQNLHASLAAYGLFGTALGAGIGIGAARGGALAKGIGTKRLFWLPMMLTGALFLVYGHVTSLALALGIVFPFALAGSASNVGYGPLFLHVTPKPLIGRVASIHDPALSLSRLVATAAVGALCGNLSIGFHATFLGYSFNAISLVLTATGHLALVGGLSGWYGLRAMDAPQERSH